MLTAIREKATGWIAWIIVILIIVPFAFFGLDKYLTGDGERFVAKIGGVEISDRDFQRMHQQQKQQMRRVLGKRYDADLVDSVQYKQGLLEKMINEEVVAQVANRDVYRIADPILAQEIKSVKAFQDENGFSQERYREALRYQGESPASFEAQLRRSLVVEQWRRGVTDTALGGKAEVDRLIRLDQQTREIQVARLDVNHFSDPQAVTEQQIQDYYAANLQSFQSPEKVRVEYIELSVDQVADSLDVTEDELREYYDNHLNQYNREEQRRASHLLIEVPSDADEATAKAARDLIMELRLKIDGGADFAELAKKYSQDPGSSSSGGDLGVVSPGLMGEEFDRVLSALKKGEISDPVRTEFGWHLVQVTDLVPGEARPFDEVRALVDHDLRTDKASAIFYEESEQLANRSYEQPDNLSETAEALGLPLVQSELFSKVVMDGTQGDSKDKPVWKDPQVIEAAFSEDVLKGGNNSPLIELGEEHVLVLRVNDHVPAEPIPVDKVAHLIRAKLARKGALERMRDVAARIEGQLKDGSAASAAGIQLDEPRSVRRDDQAASVELLNTVFAMPRPADGNVTTATVELASGNVLAVALKSVKDGDVAEIKDALRKVYETRLKNVNAESELKAVVARLRGDMDIEIYLKNL